MKEDFLIKRQGKVFILYAGLLDEAHAQGLRSIETTLIQVPSKDNGETAIVTATVVTDRGTFTEIGDASPGNVAKFVAPHFIRMAATRAKARALRDAINVGVTALEELAEYPESSEAEKPLTGTREANPATPTPETAHDERKLSLSPTQKAKWEALWRRGEIANETIKRLGRQPVELPRLREPDTLANISATVAALKAKVESVEEMVREASRAPVAGQDR